LSGAARGFEPLFAALRAAGDPRRKKFLGSYFAAGGFAPLYIGLTAVAARRVAYRFDDAFTLAALRRLLASAQPEHRFVALELLVRRYERGDSDERTRIARLYVESLRHVDHWALVDTSAPYILGAHLLARDRSILFELAASPRPMERRIAIVATWRFIQAHDYRDTLALAELLLRDADALLHRAVGWMLREVGKRAPAVEHRFLAKHRRAMPRLMLRSAIDHLPSARRKKWLALEPT
jgi:3-methyladenine DNA glycosylase AlkD